MIYIVIPVFNRWHFTQNCLQSLREQDYRNFRIVLVDHGSTDGTSENVRKHFPDVIVLKGDSSMWWTAAVNLGVHFSIQANADYILTLNNDLIVPGNYLASLIDVAMKRANNVIGSVAIDKRDHRNIVFAGVYWNRFTAKYDVRSPKVIYQEKGDDQYFLPTELLPGRGMLIPIQVFKEIGLFDEINFPHYQADEEFSNRCKVNGFELVVSTRSVLYCEVEENGLSQIIEQTILNRWYDLTFSMKSPLNLKRRWLWAWKVTPIPPLYFVIDMIRILSSRILNRHAN